MGEPKQINERVFVFFLVSWAVLFGGIVRIFPILGTELPVNDGGLFYAMARDIQLANFRLPVDASYNLAGIPFAYPPLALYILAFGDVVVPILQLVRWLPPMISVLTIIAFFFLSRLILTNEIQAGFATVAFAMLPAAYELTITGGGITRSFGFLFAILTLCFSFCLFQRPRWYYIFLTALTATLLVLSHPVATIHALLSVLVFWLFWGRTWKSAVSAISVAVLTLLLTAPWWVTVVARHGITPYLSAFQSGVDRLVFLMPLLRLDLGNELFLDMITILGLWGLIVALARREYFLPVWVLAIFVVGRDAQTMAMLPLAMAAALGLTALIFKGIQTLEKVGGASLGATSDPRTFISWFEGSRGAKLMLTFFLVYTVFNAFAFSLNISIHVTEQEQKALQWIADHTSPKDQFLLLTFGDPLNTPVQEWFPALTERVNLTVAQGYEWLPEQQFAHRLDAYRLLQPCLTENWDCVEDWVTERGYEYDYVYIYQGYVGREDIDEIEPKLSGWLLADLKASPDFETVYEAPLLTIFAYAVE